MSVRIGIAACFGSNPNWATLPIANLPSDTIKVRRRIRYNSFAVAFVKTPSGVSKHIILRSQDGRSIPETQDCLWLKQPAHSINRVDSLPRKLTCPKCGKDLLIAWMDQIECRECGLVVLR